MCVYLEGVRQRVNESVREREEQREREREDVENRSQVYETR